MLGRGYRIAVGSILISLLPMISILSITGKELLTKQAEFVGVFKRLKAMDHRQKYAFFYPYMFKDCPLKQHLDTYLRKMQNPTLLSIRKAPGFVLLRDTNSVIGYFKQFPDYIIKLCNMSLRKRYHVFDKNISRILYAHLLRDLIASLDLKNITIPTKWLYRAPGSQMFYEDQNYLVVAVRSDCEPIKKVCNVPTNHLDQLMQLLIVGLFQDFGPENVCAMSNETKEIVLIDTEFPSRWYKRYSRRKQSRIPSFLWTVRRYINPDRQQAWSDLLDTYYKSL